MNKIDQLYDLLRNKKAFCFVKLNDGECLAMKDHDATISRGDEKSSKLMSEKLIEALNFRHEFYFIGLPCITCASQYVDYAAENIKTTEEIMDTNIMNANIFINHNTNKTIDVFEETMQQKNIIIVTNKKNSSNIDKLAKLNIRPYKVIEVEEKYAFDTDYKRIKYEWKNFKDGDLVICLCGPLGRVLCYEWFKSNPTLTCLELGSFFDPLLKNRTYLYHTGNHKFCEECYNDKEANDCKLLEYCEDTILEKECYYLDSWEDNVNFYSSNYEKIKKNTEIRLEKEPNNQELKKILNWCIDGHNYKNNNKTQLYELCTNFYNSKNHGELDKVCKLYLEYFGHFDNNDVRKIRFYSGYANHYSNPKEAIKIYETSLMDKNLEEDIKFYTECNLTDLYPKNNEQIPKIIHLIYFKERPLQKYHYKCILSIQQNMPDYKIIIYNDIEPIDNEYWAKVKTHKNIEIKYYPRPIYFDDFKLDYVQYAADVARLDILYNMGGIYLDLDMLIIKNFDKLIGSNKDLYLSEEGEKGGSLINSFIAAKPKNGFLKLWLDSFKTGLRMNQWAYHIRESNTQLLEENLHYNIKYNIEILDSTNFFSIPWTERDKFVNLKKQVLGDEVYGIHLFDTILHEVLINNEYFD